MTDPDSRERGPPRGSHDMWEPLEKGVSPASSVTPKKTNNAQEYWAQLYIWHSERHNEERRPFLQKPPPKTPLLFVPE